jgi:DNA polymerase-3 subunit alpha
MNHELGVIDRLNFDDYFLSVWDIVAWAKRNDIAVGHGRGSVGGCLVAYLLEITNVDPLKFDLLFARFLNEDRNDYPDIDLDFEDARRGEVKEYIRQRWGKENVASITTFGEYKPKSAIKDVARVFGIDYNTMNDLTKRFEYLDELKLGTAEWARDFRKKNPDVIPVAEHLSGRIKNAGAHAAGVVISSVPLDQVLPLESRDDKGPEGRLEVTSYDMEECAEVGLIKMDVLGVKAITVVDRAIKKIGELHGEDVAARALEESMGLTDPRVYEEFNSGNLTGIFQAEATTYRNLISDMGIDNFNDLVASNALVRPGASITQGVSYIARKKGRETVSYLHPILEPILKDSYGKVLYQEQLMRIAVELAGFSWSDADVLRKIIGKKRDMQEFAKFRNQFVDGASAYISRRDAEEMWTDFEKSSLYMFNKSHAVAYSLTSYQTMWLKVNYPTEFIWSSLYNETDKSDTTGFLMEAKRIGVPILPPDVAISNEHFTLHDGTIRFGLMNVAGCGPSATENIIDNRPYRSFEEFMAKTKRTAVKRTLIESLDKVGAFESIGHISEYDHRNYYLPILSYAIEDTDDGEFAGIFSSCGDAMDGGWNIVKGVVKTTTRKPHFFRVEIEDGTGIASGFMSDRSDPISTRDYVVAMFHDNNLLAYTDATTYREREDDKFVNFMRNHMVDQKWYDFDVQTKNAAGTIGVLLEVKKIKAKTGFKFVSIQYWDGHEIRGAKVDYEVYKTHESRLEMFNTVVLKLQSGRSGDKLVDIRLLEEYLEMKGLEAEILV